jgi:hypothetical protein
MTGAVDQASAAPVTTSAADIEEIGGGAPAHAVQRPQNASLA